MGLIPTFQHKNWKNWYMKKEAKLKKEERKSGPLAIPDCDDEEIKEFTDVIKSGWLTTALRCATFEEDPLKLLP
jgi:hypothetical protein